MLQIMDHDLFQSFTNEVREAGLYVLIMDESTDISFQSAGVDMVWFHPKDLHIQELFCGFVNTADTRGARVFSILKDGLCHFNLSIDNCRHRTATSPRTVRAISGEHHQLGDAGH